MSLPLSSHRYEPELRFSSRPIPHRKVYLRISMDVAERLPIPGVLTSLLSHMRTGRSVRELKQEFPQYQDQLDHLDRLLRNSELDGDRAGIPGIRYDALCGYCFDFVVRFS